MAHRTGTLRLLEIVTRQIAADGSIKHLLRLSDGLCVESVFLPAGNRQTICVSSQVGCVLDCVFCATGRLGFRRNLSADEICGQLTAMGTTATNVVFMGMGEPFYNYDNVLEAADRFADQRGPAIAARRITISTAGVLPGIERYFREERPYHLAISITSALAAKRDLLMPINRRFPLADLEALLRALPRRSAQRVMLEVPVFAGLNDGPEDVEALRVFCRGLPVRVNLIAWNPVELGESSTSPAVAPGSAPFARPSRESLLTMQAELRQEGLPVFIRRSLGQDIAAACGQLAGVADRMV